MVEFLVSLGLICVLPYSIVMFELSMRKRRAAIQAELDRATSPAAGSHEVTLAPVPAFVPVTFPLGMAGRWSRACSEAGATEGGSLLRELVHNERLVPSPFGPKERSRSPVIGNTLRLYQHRLRHSGSICLN